MQVGGARSVAASCCGKTRIGGVSSSQIAGWLKWKHPQNEARQVSHETIYRSLYVQARGVLKKQLIEHLRSQRPIRRSRHATQKGDLRGRIVNAVSIAE